MLALKEQDQQPDQLDTTVVAPPKKSTTASGIALSTDVIVKVPLYMLRSMPVTEDAAPSASAVSAVSYSRSGLQVDCTVDAGDATHCLGDGI